MTTLKKTLTFAGLVDSIKEVDLQLAQQASKAVNISLTLRNWFIGMYIEEYELQGADRAQYGEKLLAKLSTILTDLTISNCNKRQLYRYVRFYKFYPGIVGTLTPQLKQLLPASRDVSSKAGTASPQFAVAPETIVTHLSYSMIELITDIEDPLKRAFYEVECIQGNWSVRELKRYKLKPDDLSDELVPTVGTNSEITGKSITTLYNGISLLKLFDEIQAAIREEKFPVSQGYLFAANLDCPDLRNSE